jgi:hypothetical protein
MESHIQNEIDLEHGVRLTPGLFVFHLQLLLCDWLEEQTRTGQRFSVDAPDFAQHLRMFERQNNLNWLPLVNNVPAFQDLRVT